MIDERTAEIIRLANEGLRASEIAKRIGSTKHAVSGKLRRRGAVGGVLLSPQATRVSPEYEAMLRRVASWDAAAAQGLAVLERQRATTQSGETP